VAGQANANGKSKVCLVTTPVTVDDEDFNRWVGTRLDIAFGPRPPMAVGPSAGLTSNQPAMDSLKLSQMLSTTIGTNMMQFSQAVTPTVGAAGATGSETALATGKGFDQDQIAKLKDACGVRNAQQIPAIWLKAAATVLEYSTAKGIPIDRIDTHSFRSGGANALSLSGYSDTQIQKMGRWRGATFKEYIREELACFSEGMSKRA
jgi:hypothetical protein